MNHRQAEEMLGVSLESLGADIEIIGDQSYVELQEDGVSCVSNDNKTITAVQLHNHGHEGYSRYEGALPGNLKLSMGRAETRGLLGTPHKCGDEGNVPVLGHMPAWDVFEIGQTRVHVEYSIGCDVIGMITLTVVGE